MPLITKYKYLEMVKRYNLGETSVWNVMGSGKSYLGCVKWFGVWRQYCFYPGMETVFSTSCMTDIQHFIHQLMDERKQMKKKKEKGRGDGAMTLDRSILVADIDEVHERLSTMVRDLSAHLVDAINDSDFDSAEEISGLICSAMATNRKILDILEK